MEKGPSTIELINWPVRLNSVQIPMSEFRCNGNQTTQEMRLNKSIRRRPRARLTYTQRVQVRGRSTYSWQLMIIHDDQCIGSTIVEIFQ